MRTADGIIIFCYNTTKDKDNSQCGPFLVVTNSPLTYNCEWIIKAYPYLFCCSCKNLSRSYALLKVKKVTKQSHTPFGDFSSVHLHELTFIKRSENAGSLDEATQTTGSYTALLLLQMRF